MTECYCDYETPTVYSIATPTAKRSHKCIECGNAISIGERYERITSLFDGEWDTYKTCCRCIAVREYVKAHVPCFCWYHYNLLDDADAAMDEYAHLVPGMRMEYGRLRVLTRQRRASRANSRVSLRAN